jgi:hypothetical protein
VAESKALTISFKLHTGYDSPMVAIFGDTVEEAGENLAKVRQLGIFGAVKAAAAEFVAAPTTTEQAVAVIQQTIPGSQVVQQQAPAPVQPQPQYQQPAQQGPPLPAAQLPGQQASLTPACTECGGPTEHKSGTGRTGPWSAYMCINTRNAPRGQGHKPQWL